MGMINRNMGRQPIRREPLGEPIGSVVAVLAERIIALDMDTVLASQEMWQLAIPLAKYIAAVRVICVTANNFAVGHIS